LTPAAILSLTSLALFSLADLRYRVVPGAAVFFLGSVLLAIPEEPLRVGLVVLAVGWGWLRWPSILIIPALFMPSAWAVLLTGAGVRRGMVGGADLLVLGGVACLFDWPATVMALGGVEIWRRWWVKQRSRPHRPAEPLRVPALPGMLIGIVCYWFLTLL
jgi:hypothetical protein